MQIKLVTGGGVAMDELNRSLAILEAEMVCKNLHKSNDVLSALEYVRQYTAEELYEISKFKTDEIERICNYWGGND